MQVLKMQEGVEPVELAGVGLVTADGVSLERAAESMSELQADGRPLEGDALVKAAGEYVAAHPFLTVGDDVAHDVAPAEVPVAPAEAPSAPVAPDVPVPPAGTPAGVIATGEPA